MTRFIQSRTAMVLLFSSLAVNLLLIGALAGQVGRSWLDASPQRSAHHRADGHTLFRDRPVTPALREQHQALQHARAELATLLMDEHPDADAIEQQLSAMRDHSVALQQLAQAQFIERMLAMPPDQRREQIKRLDARRPGGMPFPGLPPPPHPRGSNDFRP